MAERNMSAEMRFISVQADKFDEATLRLSAAKSIIAALGVFAGDDAIAHEVPVTGSLLSEALFGVGILLSDVEKNLLDTTSPMFSQR